MELQGNLQRFAENGIDAYAISYDSVEVLRAFADRFAIGYPLLSDAESQVIRRFGILNTLIPTDHPWYGVPFPGTYMVDAEGRVVEKSFYANHGVRDAIARMLQEGFGVEEVQGGVAQSAAREGMRVRARLCSKTVRPGQVLTFAVEIEIGQGLHIQARSLPEGYVPVTLSFADVEGVHFGEVSYPPGRPHRLEALGETLHVYEGAIVLKAAVRNRRREAFSVRARLEYQACDARECFLPERIDFELPVEFLENVRD